MRALLLLAIVAGALGVCATAAASGSSEGSVAAYKGRVNQVCRAVGKQQLADIRKLAAAHRAHDDAGEIEATFTLIDHGYRGVKSMLAVPVPLGARAQMKPIRRDFARMVAFFDRLDPAATPILFYQAAEKADKVGRRLDPLLDKVGLGDCGSRMTARLDRAAAAAYDTGGVA